jgi:subfamily B ATP-binding cassette protein HlyB/CyaB
MTRRAGLGELARRFDITWFLQAMHKYRRLLGEVLIASFFLQLFALSRRCSSRSSSTRCWCIAASPRSMSSSSAWCRVGFRERADRAAHLCLLAHHQPHRRRAGRAAVPASGALPISYFEARRAGDSVARVRELENIRNFLTSSALTLVIDLFFTFVFLA